MPQAAVTFHQAPSTIAPQAERRGAVLTVGPVSQEVLEMFSFFLRRPRVRRHLPRRQARPVVEALESRDCPAAPQITLGVTMLDGQTALLSGTVVDENPATVLIAFGGAAAGQTVPEPSGNYRLVVEADELGTVVARGVDEEMLSSNEAAAELANAPPLISDFQAIRQEGNAWVFSGRVADENAAGLQVRLGGLTSLEGREVVVDATGWFSVSLTLAEGEEGTATAQVTDPGGLESDLALTLIRP
jgi:hypothetical protein